MKKKVIQGLLTLAALASGTVVNATAVGKTFMNDRGSLSNNTLISIAGHNKCGHSKKNSIGATISVAPFYRQSYNNDKLAQYFGDGSPANPSGRIDVALGAATTTGLSSGQIDIQSLTAGDVAREMYGSAVLAPRRIEAGAQFQWDQNLNKFVDGMWASVSAPVVYVRTAMNATYPNTIPNTTTSVLKGEGFGIADYFSGKNLGKTSPITQDALCNQVLTPTYNSTTQIADLKVVIGYTFLKEKDYQINASIHALIPTGNKEAGAVAFEPFAGNRSFFFGAGLGAHFNLWRSEDRHSKFDMRTGACYSYGFSAEQVRTLGQMSTSTGSIVDGQYALVGSNGTVHAMPLANVSTLAVSVIPGSRLEGIAGFSYRYNGFTANVTYNLFYNQAEELTLNGNWNSTQYANVVSAGITTGTGGVPFSATPGVSGFVIPDTYTTPVTIGGAILNPGNTAGSYALDLSAATTPAQVVHKVGGDLEYRFSTKIPVHTAVGAEVDLSSNNTSINSWGVWAKVGFSF